MPVLNSTTVLIEVKSTASTLRKAESTSRGMSDISTTAGLPECHMLTKDEGNFIILTMKTYKSGLNNIIGTN